MASDFLNQSVYGWCGGARCSAYGMGGGLDAVSIDIEDFFTVIIQAAVRECAPYDSYIAIWGEILSRGLIHMASRLHDRFGEAREPRKPYERTDAMDAIGIFFGNSINHVSEWRTRWLAVILMGRAILVQEAEQDAPPTVDSGGSLSRSRVCRDCNFGLNT